MRSWALGFIPSTISNGVRDPDREFGVQFSFLTQSSNRCPFKESGNVYGRSATTARMRSRRMPIDRSTVASC